MATDARPDRAATVLFLTTVWPGARRSGGELVSQAVIDALRAAGHRVAVVGYRRQGEQRAPHPDDVIATDRAIETRGAGHHVAAWAARAALTRAPYSVAKFVSPAYRRAVERLAADRPDLVVVDHAQMGWAAPAGSSTPIIHLAHNVEHDLYGGQVARQRGLRRSVYAREARRIAAIEAGLVAGARVTWALSEADALSFRALAPGADIRVLGVPPGVGRATAAAHADVVLLGRWTWAANAAGLEWFLGEVVPLLEPGMAIEVGGAGARRRASAGPALKVDERVDDAAAFLAGGRAIAVPARAGAGVQIKTLDAIASGRPVVATSLALRGLRDLPPTVTVADDAAEFAARLAAAVTREPSCGELEAVDAWSASRRRRFELDVRQAVDDVLADGQR